jgi:hypothetical protein
MRKKMANGNSHGTSLDRAGLLYQFHRESVHHRLRLWRWIWHPVISGGSLISAAASSASEPWRLTDDFMYVWCGFAADVGAFQRTGVGSGPVAGRENYRPPRQ